MKQSSKSLKFLGLSGLSVIMASVVVLPAFAVENTTSESKTGTALCTRITSLSFSGRAGVSEKRSTLQTDFSKRLTNISTRQTEVDAKIEAGRTKATTTFEEKVAVLEAKTDLTDEQKTAIATFKTGVEEAMTTRRAAVDDARSAYRTAVATQISTQQQTLSTAVTTYQAAVSSAFATATADCTADNATETLATLKADLKTARETLDAARTPDASKAAIEALVKTRNAAIKAANDTFKTTVQELATTLKTALGITDTTGSSDATN